MDALMRYVDCCWTAQVFRNPLPKVSERRFASMLQRVHDLSKTRGRSCAGPRARPPARSAAESELRLEGSTRDHSQTPYP
jgi:hypothetical protein